MGLVVNFARDLETPLLKVSPWDVFTCRDACSVHVFGGIGSGKTSGSGRMLAGAYLRAGMGGLVTAVKPETIPEEWAGYTAGHGRGNSFIVFDENEGFNFLSYLMALQGMAGIGAVTETLMHVIDVARRASASASHHGGEPFWEDAMREALRYTIPALYAAHGSVDIPGIIRFVSTAPKNLNEPASKEWQRSSFMYQVMARAGTRPVVPMPQGAMMNAVRFWSERWAGTPEKTKGNVVATITATLDRFNHGRLNRVFCGKTSIVPELSLLGGIIGMYMPTTTWNEDGVIAQQLFKFIWQRMVLRRNSLPETYRERFVFLWCDEAQETVNPFDGEFLSLCRQSKCCMTYLTQSLPTYYSKIGGDNPKDAALALAGKFMTHIYHSNACPETNEFASRMIGKVMTRRGNYSNSNSRSRNLGMSAGDSENSGSSSSWSFGGATTTGQNSGSSNNWGSNRGRGESENVSRGYTEGMEYAIEPGDFARHLLNGGPQNRNIVTSVWFQAGRVFKASGTNFLLGRFEQ